MTAGVDIATDPPDGWDELAVDRPGGHVYQSKGWARHRRASGWRPLFVSVDDQRVLVLTRPWPLLGGGSAYIPRGPAPTASGEIVGGALWETTRSLAERGIDVVAVDPEFPASDESYAALLRRARFRRIDEIQPSRHRISLPLGAGADEAGILSGIAKSTRQRIRKAEKTLDVVRFDTWPGSDGVGEGFARPADPAEPALHRFYDLLLDTGERRHFSFGSREEFVGWWIRALTAGHLVYLEARTSDDADEPVAGLILYRHGNRLSTVHSGDTEASRRAHPGALHLLRWRAIQLAIREGRAEMDLGGVDVPGARREPREGEPMYGLYQHKLSFGGTWLELAGAHERVIRPRRYRAGRLVAGALRAARRLPIPLPGR